ncbi:MAG: toxin-antitoxin system YwqK family antitoxin [Euryarchaeota archaeon]|nr:toxin-antitoxin system YwqK family antitoxin [Euryarchaeota archaeon]
MNELNYMGRINHQLGRRLILILISFLIIFVLLASPVSSLEAVIDDDCNINQDVFDRDWKKYSDIDERIPLDEREWPAQQYGVTQSKIVDAEVQIFFLKRDAEVDRLMCLELKECKKALVHEQKVNLLKSFWKLSYYTAATTYKAYRAGISIGMAYVNLITTMSSVSELGSTLKILTDGFYQLTGNSLAFADNTQSITEATAWGTFGTSLSGAYEALESLGDPKKIGVAVFTQVSREAEATLPSATLSDEEVDILRTQYLKSHRLDHTRKQRYKAYLEGKDKVRKLEAQIKEWENELVKWEAEEKSRVKESLVDSCKKEKEKKCDSEHLSLCDNENDCEDAGGYWYNNQCNKEAEEKEECDDEHLNLCDNEKECGDAGGYWYNNQCNVNPEEDTSDGEFNCPIPIPNEASHIVSDRREYWRTPNGFVGPHYSWYDREKTKKHCFRCYNIEGKVHGVSKWWYEDGTLEIEGNYKDGKFHGVSKWWYEDGTLKEECNYKDGKRHGVSKWWYRDGTLKEECNYKDGKFHGVCKRWYEDGTLEEDNYKDGKRHGVCKEWSANGKLLWECNYEEGNCVSCVHGDC